MTYEDWTALILAGVLTIVPITEGSDKWHRALPHIHRELPTAEIQVGAVQAANSTIPPEARDADPFFFLRQDGL